MRSFKYNLILAMSCFMIYGCNSLLEEDIYSQLDSNVLFETEEGIEKVLFTAYTDAQINDNFGGNIQFQEEWTCDQFWETGGAVNLQAVVMTGFTWDASYPTQFNDLWTRMYSSIRNCNLVIDGIGSSKVDDNIKKRLVAEARFVRSSAYYKMLMMWGGVPLRTSSSDELEKERASYNEVRDFIETELLDILNDLPNKGEVSGYEYGRATKGAAMGYLCKLYLNTKQWQKCIDMSQKIMDLHIYELWNDYLTLFTVDNEMTNKEFIWVYTCNPLGPGNQIINGAFPTNFSSTVDGKIVFTSNMRNWARMDRLYDSFYNSFASNDIRKNLIITEYIDNKGKKISLLNNNDTRSFKYIPDKNAIGNFHGNDIPVIRYADILLARAEALNEINGPTQEALDLLQEIRDRAGLHDKLNLADFTKETFRERILQERSWEFYGENLRREDLIRQGKFVEYAKKRGISHADEHHQLFPIPQKEIDANPKCEQNPGY